MEFIPKFINALYVFKVSRHYLSLFRTFDLDSSKSREIGIFSGPLLNNFHSESVTATV
jgi:hypothetical protein